MHDACTPDTGRLRAFLVHLSISGIIGILVGLVFWFVLYPAPLFRAVGGLDIFLVVLAVDVVLGPCITLLIFRRNKKGLVFDLAAIAAVQIAALAYGVMTLYAGRPVYVAALGPRFEVIQASEIDRSDLAESGQELPRWGPLWVGVREEPDPVKRSDMIFSALAGVDYGHKPKYHAPLAQMQARLLAEARPIAELRMRNVAADAEITAWLQAKGYADDAARFVGLKARAQDMAVILDAKTAIVVGVAPFRPWD